MASEFLTIIPAGWIRVPDDILRAANPDYVNTWTRENNMHALGDALKEVWPEGPDGVSQAAYLNGEILVVK